MEQSSATRIAFEHNNGACGEAGSQVTVRHATLDDVEFLLQSGRLFYLESASEDIAPFDYRSLGESIAELFANPGCSIILIAERAGVPVGSIAVRLAPVVFHRATLIGQDAWWWVAPEHRLTGAGSMLICRMEEEMQKIGGKISSILVFGEGKSPERVLLRRLGYTKRFSLFIKVG